MDRIQVGKTLFAKTQWGQQHPNDSNILQTYLDTIIWFFIYNRHVFPTQFLNNFCHSHGLIMIAGNCPWKVLKSLLIGKLWTGAEEGDLQKVLNYSVHRKFGFSYAWKHLGTKKKLWDVFSNFKKSLWIAKNIGRVLSMPQIVLSIKNHGEIRWN